MVLKSWGRFLTPGFIGTDLAQFQPQRVLGCDVGATLILNNHVVLDLRDRDNIRYQIHETSTSKTPIADLEMLLHKEHLLLPIDQFDNKQAARPPQRDRRVLASVHEADGVGAAHVGARRRVVHDAGLGGNPTRARLRVRRERFGGHVEATKVFVALHGEDGGACPGVHPCGWQATVA